jgi:hypothetical protein
MVGTTWNWEDELGRWLKPFLDRLDHKARRRMCPLYVAGLIGPGERKSIQPMAERLAPGDYDQLHHFVAAGVWDAAPLEIELLVQADRLVGGSDAVLVIDDTAVPKKGRHSVGVAAQYASALGKTANCQTLVSLTLARGEVPAVADHPQINWRDDENNLDMTFAIGIQEGRITVDCEVNRFEPSLITPIFMRAFDLARAAADLTAFSSGYGLTVIFDTFTSPSGEVTPFVIYERALAPLCTAYQMGVAAASIQEMIFIEF